MTLVLILGTGLVVLGSAYFTWTIAFGRREQAWQQTKHEAANLALLAAERVHRLMKEGRR